MAKDKKDTKRRKRKHEHEKAPSNNGPSMVADDSTPLVYVGPESLPRPPWPRPRLIELVIAVPLVAAIVFLFANLPIEFVQKGWGRVAIGSAAAGLGFLAALLWGLDLIAMRELAGQPMGRGRAALLLCCFLFPPCLALAMLMMGTNRLVGVICLVLGAASLLYVCKHETGQSGEPLQPERDRE